ncbi:hypothetical protein A0O34_04260 [Chryseobacterium glaciei]|uniref:Uncharacterized protein n=1 Tax=Chryseobacterium glaciei TaxID=1685010 RepID=A0A172XS70_9FLAO|nr:hypothetical protein A0O34_04260 [Chryseobacterium glaciei]
MGIGTANPTPGSMLDVFSTNKGFLPPRLTTAQRDGINPKPGGLTIYNADINCLQYWNTTAWVGNCSGGTVDPGAGTITNCTTGALSGTYQQGVSMTSANTVVITVNVTTIGAWTANSNTVNGVQFTGSGDFTSPGSQNITLRANGVPVSNGTFPFSFTVGSSTACVRNITFSASQGGGTISCNNAVLSGTYKQGTAMTSANKIELNVTPASTGPWSASSNSVNGIKFEGSGDFQSIATQKITLYASGTPQGAGDHNFIFTLGSSTCNRNINFASNQGTIIGLDCSQAVQNNVATANSSYSDNMFIKYTGGNGGPYAQQFFNSKGILGLTAEISAGNFVNGSGDIQVKIGGTPTSTGRAYFEINLDGKSCYLYVFVVAPPDLGNACYGFALPHTGSGGQASGPISTNKFVTATFNHTNVGQATGVYTFCGTSNDTSKSFALAVAQYSYSTMTVKFDKPVVNLKVKSVVLNSGEDYTITLKRNNKIISSSDIIVSLGQTTCNGSFTISKNGNSIYVKRSGSGVGNIVYNLGGVWFDEMTLEATNHNSGNGFNLDFCIGDAL